jgi:hypothetical protein
VLLYRAAHAEAELAVASQALIARQQLRIDKLTRRRASSICLSNNAAERALRVRRADNDRVPWTMTVLRRDKIKYGAPHMSQGYLTRGVRGERTALGKKTERKLRRGRQ